MTEENLSRKQRKIKKQKEQKRLKSSRNENRKFSKVEELNNMLFEAYNGKNDAAERLDSMLFHNKERTYVRKESSKIKKLLIGVFIFEILFFLYLIMYFPFPDLAEKSVVIGGYTIVVAVTMPIIQNILNKSDGNSKVEYLLFFISELLLEEKAFENPEDRIRYEEILFKIQFINNPEIIRKEEFEHYINEKK
ncbi:hypothetical protein [Lysinibacillus xylanilyticus]|uniref:hypothetical protein n=1 Tax=Lysinibacillus xylanilyticus TaxID=582475 RepID=UPI003D00D397